MSLNTTPVFTLGANISWANITTAQTDLTGVAATSVFTAGANGSFAINLTVKSNTTTTTSSAATLRIFISNGSGFGTPANNTLIREFTLGPVTASSTSSTLNYEFPLNLQLPPGYQLGVEIATMAASTGWQVTCIGADY
jgi:hypothetical protein